MASRRILQFKGLEEDICRDINTVIASVAKQSIFPRVEAWIASLRSQ